MGWMRQWPFALPNVLSAIFIFFSLVAVFFGLDEVCACLFGGELAADCRRHMKLRVIGVTGAGSWDAKLRGHLPGVGGGITVA